jgi:uncharacterized protein YllA (UPF0747 family)
MTPGQLHRLLIAPEIIVVDLVDHALRALGLALLAALLRRTRALRRALGDYRTQVQRVLRQPDEPELPF